MHVSVLIVRLLHASSAASADSARTQNTAQPGHSLLLPGQSLATDTCSGGAPLCVAAMCCISMHGILTCVKAQSLHLKRQHCYRVTSPAPMCSAQTAAPSASCPVHNTQPCEQGPSPLPPRMSCSEAALACALTHAWVQCQWRTSRRAGLFPCPGALVSCCKIPCLRLAWGRHAPYWRSKLLQG